MAVPLERSPSNSEGSAGQGAHVLGGFGVHGCRGLDFVASNWNNMFEIWSSLLWVLAAWACTCSSFCSRKETHSSSMAETENSEGDAGSEGGEEGSVNGKSGGLVWPWSEVTANPYRICAEMIGPRKRSFPAVRATAN